MARPLVRATRPRSSASVVVVSGEETSDRPAGPALRALGLAAGLEARGIPADVRDLTSGPEAATNGASVAIVNLSVAARSPGLLLAPYLVVDAAGPFLVESLWVNASRSAADRRSVLCHEADAVASVLERADLILVANEAQRSLILGLLLGRGLVRPELLDEDPSLADLVVVLPFAVERADRPPARPSRPSVAPLSIVWPGGLWDWLDPLTLIEAIALARADGVDLRAELWGTGSPDPAAPRARVVDRLRERIAAIGLADDVTLVDWVPYGAFGPRLETADLAVTLDPGGVEARFAFRTRLVHALSLGVPTLATRGETVADRAAAAGAGWTIAPGDAAGAARLLGELAGDRGRLQAARSRTAAAIAGLDYDELVEPLARFCAAPVRQRPGPAPDAARRFVGRLVRRARARAAR